ncbi:hypothetical protein, partial [Chryseosolibacter indicus]
MSNNLPSSSPIDPKQIQKVEEAHRGFLYQHVYGVACLITLKRNGAKTLVVNNDEDIDLIWPDKRLYLHIKTSSNLLQWDDIKGSVDKFESFRKEHVEGIRSGNPQFVIITNVELDNGLTTNVQHPFWPKDIAIQTPKSKKADDHLPPAWPDLMQGLKWCADNVSEMPLGATASEKLVWKLTSRIQHAATTSNRQNIEVEEVSSLLDRFVVQLKNLPQVPQNYKLHQNEPLVQSNNKIRLIKGVSGSGKTAWAAQAFLHIPDVGAYFDVSNVPKSALAGSLARELAAQFLGNNATGTVASILSNKSGIDMLSAIDNHFGQEEINVNVFLDNVHLLKVDTLKALVEVTHNIKFTLLAQPWSELSLLETTLGITSEELKGWTTDIIAQEFKNAKCSVNTDATKEIKDLTLGLPLFVKNAVQVMVGSYKGSAKSFINEITSRSQILSKTFRQLSQQAQQVIGILSLVDVPLSVAEIDEISEVIIKDKGLVSSSLKELDRYGILEHSISGEIKLHDIFRGLEHEIFQKTPGYVRIRIKQTLAEVLQRSMPSNLGRFVLWIRLLAETDQIDTLVDLATFDWFHEMGDPGTLKN